MTMTSTTEQIATTAARSAASLDRPRRALRAGDRLDRGHRRCSASLRPDTFLSWANFSTIFGSQAVLVVVTLGLIIPLTAGDYDLSIAGMLTLSSMMIAVLNVYHGWPIAAAVAAALARRPADRRGQRLHRPLFPHPFADRHARHGHLHPRHHALDLQLPDHQRHRFQPGHGRHRDAPLRHPAGLLLRISSRW